MPLLRGPTNTWQRGHTGTNVDSILGHPKSSSPLHFVCIDDSAFTFKAVRFSDLELCMCTVHYNTCNADHGIGTS